MEISPFTPSLGSVVLGYPKISVDDYQRTYQWERAQLDEFFIDLVETADRGDNHFFGTLILQESPDGVVSVVDGQQRLTTVFILVSALRDHVYNLGAEHIIQNDNPNQMPVDVRAEIWKFLFWNDNFGKHRFESNRFLRELMAQRVIAEPNGREALPQRDRQVTLEFRKAVRILGDKLQKELDKSPSNDDKLKRIYDLYKVIRDQLIVLRVQTRTIDESLEIFLTLNNRGLPLGPSDLVRGEIIRARSYGLSPREQAALHEDVFNEWESLTENVKDPDVFLRHYLVATGTDAIQKKKVVSTVIARLANADAEIRKDLARDFWEDLLNAGEVYGNLINPISGTETDYRLMQLEGLLKSYRILLLTAFRKITDASLRDEIARVTVVLSYRWVIAGMNAQDLEKFFQQQSTYLREGGSGNDVIVAVKAKATEPAGDLTKFLISDGDTSFVTRAILHAIDRNVRHGAIQIPLNGKLHLEHIAPKAGKDDWKIDLFVGDTDKFDLYDTVISEAGNLTLLDQNLNIQAQRKSFALKKQDHYIHATLTAITQDLCTLPDWTQDVVRERTKWLVDMFERLWAIENANAQAIKFSHWLEGDG